MDDPGGGTADDDPGGGSITSADADSALIVSNTSKTSSSPLLSSFATGLTSSRDSSSIMAKKLVSDNSDDEDVEYKGHFCSGCSIPPPGGVRGWVRGYGGVGLWEAGPGCACCEVCIIRAFQDHPKSYVEWAITQIPPVSRAI